MYVVEQNKLKENFDDFVLACKRARILGNSGKPARVTKNGKELYKTGG